MNQNSTHRYRLLALTILLGLGLAFALPHPAYASDPAPALIIVAGDYADLQAVRRQVEQAGGRVGHIFPPNALIARLTPDQANRLRPLSQITTITFEPVTVATKTHPNLPVSIWNDVFHSLPLDLDLRPSEPFSDDVLIAPDLPPNVLSLAKDDLSKANLAFGADYYDTSRYMLGDIIVAAVLPESNGVAEPSTQDWTVGEVTTVQNTTVSGLDKWAQAEPNANITFVYVWADVPPTGGVSYTVESDYEAESHSNFDSSVINSFMSTLGYTSTSSFTNIRDYLNDLRDTYDSDWVYMIQAKDDSGSCGRASAYLHGPITTIFDCDLRSGYVAAHETGHIFGAMDEYCPDACRSPTGRYGYLQAVNANSAGPGTGSGPGFFNGNGEGLGNIMNRSGYKIGPYTRGAMGWYDDDGDGVLNIRDTFPNTTLYTSTVGVTIEITGQASVIPLLGSGNDISLNTIAGVEVRLNGLTWLPALPTDGAFDSAQENYVLTLPLLPNGDYTVQARAQNDVGNIERSYAEITMTISSSPVSNTAPLAAFSATPALAHTNTAFSVDASASRDLESQSLEFRWDWDSDSSWDTGWSATISATHTYTTPGIKMISLQVQDSLSALSLVTRSVEVAVTNTTPVAGFVIVDGARRFGTISPTFTFDATTSRDGETTLADLEFRWDFDGNGSWDTGWATAANQVVSHTFTLDSQGKSDGLPRSDHWPTTLQVRDGDGATAQTTNHIWANPYNHWPVATRLFSETVVHTAAPLPIDFAAIMDSDIGTSWDGLLKYRFDWDSDGNWDTHYSSSSTWANYQHTEPGDYLVTMEVRDRFLAIDRISQTISIVEPPNLQITDKLEATTFVSQNVSQTLVLTNSGQYTLTYATSETLLGVPITYTVVDNITGPLTYEWVQSWPDSYYPTLSDFVSTTIGRDADDEGYVGPIELGLPFPFYGEVYTEVYLAANGYLSFEPPPADFGSGTIPAGASPNGLISAFWADLNLSIIATEWPTDGMGSMAYNSQTESGAFVAEYSSVGLVTEPGWNGNTFEIVLQPDGSILLQYSSIYHTPTGPTGIENIDGSQGVTYTGSLTNNLAIAFIPDQDDIPWLNLSMESGEIRGKSSELVTANFDATGLMAGTYSGRLLVSTNDPDSPLVNVPVTFTVDAMDLVVSKDGNGTGQVNGDPAGIACGLTCTLTVEQNIAITLTAVADPGSAFAGWAGACSGIGNCVVTMTETKSVTATFDLLPTYTLAVNIVGSGSVMREPVGTLLPPSWLYRQGTVVTLTATPNLGWYLSGWSGALEGTTSSITLTMDADKAITATFDQLTHTLTVNTAGDGTGTVDLDPPDGIYDHGTSVTLTAGPAPGSYFGGWTGDLISANSLEILVMDADKDITVTFRTVPPVTYTLTIAVAGSGNGTVTPTVGTHTYTLGEIVILTATAAPNSEFVGWLGALNSTTSPITLTMTCHSEMACDKTITATFDLLTHTLTINIEGDGSGTVDLDPADGIYNHGTGITLTAVPALGSYFGGWMGDLVSANNPDTLVMDEDKEITATFSTEAPVTHTLTVLIVGSGTVDPAGGTYISRTMLSLSATPDPGWQFEGWSDDVISTSNPISVTMTGDMTVTATFEQTGYNIYLPLVLRNQ
ncbi:MAG: hypothetical protein GY832_15060 [Chloroflexi bacterium]|nr:hypothetical protein [Chloroflexota bacterium]